MKNYIPLCLSVLILCVASPNTRAFVAWGNEPMPNQDHLAERLAYIESTLGIQHAWYNYSIPSDKKLIATFTRSIDGKKSDSVYQITPFKDGKPTDTQICLTLLSPADSMLNHSNAAVSVSFISNKCQMASFSFPVPSASIQGSGGSSLNNTPQSPSPDQTNAIKAFDSVVWNADSKESFGFQMTVKFVGLEPKDKMGSISQLRGNGDMSTPPFRN